MAVSDSELILQVVRGERPWTDLQSLGITIQLLGMKSIVENPRRVEAVAGASDVARGLLRHRQHPTALREWAQVLMAGIPFLDLELGDNEVGDELLHALWDLVFGEPIPEATFELAERLAGPA